MAQKQVRKLFRITEAKFRQLVMLFYMDLDSNKVTVLACLNHNIINRYLKARRERIAEYCKQTSPNPALLWKIKILPTLDILIQRLYFVNCFFMPDHVKLVVVIKMNVMAPLILCALLAAGALNNGYVGNQMAEHAAVDRDIVKVDVYGNIMPEEYFFWRNTLSEAEKILYDDIYYAAVRLERRIPVNGGVDIDRAAEVLEAVRHDNPELFWLDNALYYFYVPGSLIAVELIFNPEEERIPAYREVFDRTSGEVLAHAMTLPSDAQKVKFIHDLLFFTNVYNIYADYDQSAFSAVVSGESVCMGFALAFKYYMQRLGIPCALILGDAGAEIHAWNIVKLDGEYYNIDVTWNNTGARPSGSFRYTYFNLTDEQMSPLHIRMDVCRSFPAAAGTRYAFGNYEGFKYGSDFSMINIERNSAAPQQAAGQVN